MRHQHTVPDELQEPRQYLADRFGIHDHFVRYFRKLRNPERNRDLRIYKCRKRIRLSAAADLDGTDLDDLVMKRISLFIKRIGKFYGSVYRDDPSFRSLDLAELDPRQGIIQLL